MNNIRLSDITLIHCIGVIMIFCCHFAQVMNKSVIGELLIAGVPLFLFVSGYLTGLNEKHLNAKWLQRKCYRILTPYYLLLVIILCVYLATNVEEFHIKQWLFLLFNLQGFSNFLFLNDATGYYAPLSQGVGHLWYVTIIMVCYIAIIAFSRIYEDSYTIKRRWKTFLLLTILLVQPLLLYYNLSINCIMVFVSGWLYAKNTTSLPSRKLYCRLTLIMLGCIMLRILTRMIIDDTLFYNAYISVITSDMIGIWVFFTLHYLYSKHPRLIDKLSNTSFITFFESIIYEFFLIHHLFIKGSWSIVNKMDDCWIAIVVILVITIILSYGLKKGSVFINTKLKSIVKNEI